ncbi:hypothetical protein EU805_10865 [Salipiger sp. IMCC34102]|uniref:HlyU family transcriptional regulator n=1 Tax=Salipiger sp. IMCC34102 TaxID=2510647 RepID=UPI00101C191F|nr:HlyU family transcriptional regulator [Salipiger sp. IMCC34102]RYH02342.1 hypothetical protein EU805_10865 [Salipiger sp. IMCC34102]
MSWLGKFFGGGKSERGDSAPAEAASVEHKGHRITPTPQAEGKTYRLAARIERDGKVHTLIRADTFTDPQEASQAAIAKARQVIDEQGASLYG